MTGIGDDRLLLDHQAAQLRAGLRRQAERKPQRRLGIGKAGRAEDDAPRMIMHRLVGHAPPSLLLARATKARRASAYSVSRASTRAFTLPSG